MGAVCGKTSDDRPKDGFSLEKKNLIKIKTNNIREEYSIGDLIGKDKFATISKCRHKETKKRYIAKTFTINQVDAQILEAFLNEAQLLQDADHPNIMKVIDIFRDSSSAVIVTEYCRGGELLERLQTAEKLSENQVAGYMKQISSAIAYLHSKKIIHRDLRPESISFLHDTPDSCLKITEFGSCKHFEKNLRILERVGCPAFMAPEVISGNYTEKCDVWSMGVMLYLLLSGTLPYVGNSENEIMLNVLNNDISFEGKKWKKVSKDAKDLISKMMKRDINERLSATDVYQHPWIKDRSANLVPDNEIIGSTLKSLSQFETESKLQRATLAFIVSQLMSSDELGNLRDVFREIDQNGDGMLSEEEIRNAMTNNTGFSEENIKELIAKVDLDKNGLVNYSEFLAATVNWENEMSRERLEEAFKAFDADHSGGITVDELEKAFGGSHKSRKMFMDMLNEADVNGDGQIDLEEFCNYMCKLKKTAQ